MFLLALACAWWTCAGTARAQSPSPARAADAPPAQRPWTLGGQIFGDYYYVAAHDPREAIASDKPDDLMGRSGFWLRRVYLTYDHTFTARLSTRLQLEANSPGDFVSGSTADVFVKDASVRWRGRRIAVSAGLVPTVSMRLADTVWGLRSVEKTPLDLYRLDSTADLGASVSGTLPGDARWRYEAQVGNGAGTGAETNDAKSVRAAVSFEPARGLFAQAYVDRQGRSDDADWTTFSALAGWRDDRWRAALLYARQSRGASTHAGPGADVDLLSLFGTASAFPRVAIFARVDRVFDPLPLARAIAYLPLSSAAPFTTWLAGADIVIEGPLRLQPNVEIVTYDRWRGVDGPGPTVMPRVTMAVSW